MPLNTRDVRESSGSAAPEHHLRVLRDLLQRDYLGRADWSYALHDLAELAREALGAQETLVALYQPDADAWLACTSDGEMLTDEQISAHGSRSVLEEVRQTDKPLLTTTGLPLQLSSTSIRHHQLGSVLAIPLYWWDLGDAQLTRRFAGCLYAHRTKKRGAFTGQDVELILDITRIAQPSLNTLRHLRDVKAGLQASQQLQLGLRPAAARRYRLGNYETADPGFAKTVLATLRSAARAEKIGLLILGPTGSGKSHLAQAYHYECPRKEGPFVVLDCAQATSEQTLAAELFGYAPMSGFANAPPGGRPGAAELAHRGTLFMDEIGTLPLELQQKLLTLIETGTFSPLGASVKRQADIQVIAATNEDLAGLVQAKRFREDLYWRVSMVTVHLPPLSERRADIPQLALRFLRSACQQLGRGEVQGFTDPALSALVELDWSQAGNIRGLEHGVYRSVLLAAPGTRQLDAGDLRLQTLPERPESRRRAALRTVQTSEPQTPREGSNAPDLEEIKAAVRQLGYASAAARSLSIPYDTLNLASAQGGAERAECPQPERVIASTTQS